MSLFPLNWFFCSPWRQCGWWIQCRWQCCIHYTGYKYLCLIVIKLNPNKITLQCTVHYTIYETSIAKYICCLFCIGPEIVIDYYIRMFHDISILVSTHLKRTSTSFSVLLSTPSTQWPAVKTCLGIVLIKYEYIPSYFQYRFSWLKGSSLEK
jgi:hypothetical protein